MIVCRAFILISLINVVQLQLQQQTGCSSLRNAHESLCSNPYVGLAPHRVQGPPGKRGPRGFKGDKGLKGAVGKTGQAGVVEYQRVKELALHEMKQDIRCSVGLRNRISEDATISSSGALNVRSKADMARLDEQPSSNSDGAWCNRPSDQSWIEVKFRSSQLLAGIVTQGSPSSDKWVKTFSVACGDDAGHYKDYVENGLKKIFQANTGRNSKAYNIFSEVLSCRSIKLIPKSWHSAPCLRLELLHSGCYAPMNYKFYVKSQGAEDGWTCQIYVNGVEKSIRRRGFCVVIFNPASATFQAQSFDVHAHRTDQTAQMISFLDNAASHSIIAIAVQDAASNTVEQTLIAKMKQLGAVGVSCNLTTYGYRDSFAFIGQKIPSNLERPNWVRCQHVRRSYGFAAVHATISTSKYFTEN